MAILVAMIADETLRKVVARRWRIGGALTALMMVAYFGFILLVAFAKPFVGTLIVDGQVSVGIVLGVCAGLAWCGYSILQGFSAGEPPLAIGSFSPFTVLTILIDPARFGGRLFQPGGDPSTGRILVLIFSWIATGAYALLVWTMYKGMVKNFDMTIRRQSR